MLLYVHDSIGNGLVDLFKPKAMNNLSTVDPSDDKAFFRLFPFESVFTRGIERNPVTKPAPAKK